MTCPEGASLPFAEAARARLLSSGLGSLADDEKVVDLFCGGGGWGAGLVELGIRTDYAVNHDATAIEFHAANHPWCVHHRGDAWRTKPRAVVPAGERVGLLLASAACTTHSRARGSAPISKRVHMLGACILRYMADLEPRMVAVENVPEWLDWGPLVEKRDERGRVMRDAQGRALWVHDAQRKGQRWRWWVRQCRKLGYAVEWRVLDAADFGSASRRRRLFVLLRRDGQPIVWPEVTHGSRKALAGTLGGLRTMTDGEVHGRKSAQSGRNVFDEPGMEKAEARGLGLPRLCPHRSAAEVIDWSDLGTSIFDRQRPLADKTLRRIVEGARRYIFNDPKPFILRVTHGEGGGWHVAPVDQPLRTQTTRQDLAVATPVIAPQNTGVYGQRADRPGPTITTKGHQALITPILATTGYSERDGQAARAHRVSELLATAVDGVKQAVVSPVLMHNTTHHTGGPVGGLVPTVTTGGQTGLVSPVLVGAGGSTYAGKPVPADRPMGTVKCDDRRAVVAPVLSYYRHGGG